MKAISVYNQYHCNHKFIKLRLVAVFGFLVSHDLRNVDSVVGVEMWGEYKAGAGGLGRPPTRTTAHAPETTGFHTARQQAAENVFYLTPCLLIQRPQ